MPQVSRYFVNASFEITGKHPIAVLIPVELELQTKLEGFGTQQLPMPPLDILQILGVPPALSQRSGVTYDLQVEPMGHKPGVGVGVGALQQFPILTP